MDRLIDPNFCLEFFKIYGESLHGETAETLSSAAKSNQVYIIGGSFPEKKNGKYFNTSTVWDPEGKLLTVYRKVGFFSKTYFIPNYVGGELMGTDSPVPLQHAWYL